MSLSLYLQKISEQVKAETAIIRTTFKNNTNKGTGFEIVIRNLISIYLPSTLTITQGEIIDTFDTQSGQIDLIIVNNFNMRGHFDGRPNLIFYDLLTGMGEMKVSLTTGELSKIVQSSNILANFKRHPDNNNALSSEFYNGEPEQKPPPFFVIAFNSDVSPTTLGIEIKKSLISMIIILTHKKEQYGYIVLGDTHNNTDVNAAMDNFGRKIKSNVWQSDNPVLALIWGLNKFQVPFLNLTNMTPYYLK